MREIKFRAWDKENKKLYNPITIFGENSDLCGQGDRVFFIDWDTDIEQKKFIWMQFTGLTDKNGKEIYEGDITNFKVENQDQWRGAGVGQVFWNEEVCGFSIRDYSGAVALFRDYLGIYEGTLEVLGNIYENPELLEG